MFNIQMFCKTLTASTHPPMADCFPPLCSSTSLFPTSGVTDRFVMEVLGGRRRTGIGNSKSYSTKKPDTTEILARWDVMFLTSPEVQIDIVAQQQHEVELAAAVSQPLLDDDDDDAFE